MGETKPKLIIWNKMAQITNRRNEKEIRSGAEDLKQVRENYEQLKAHTCGNINGHGGIHRVDNCFILSQIVFISANFYSTKLFSGIIM